MQPESEAGLHRIMLISKSYDWTAIMAMPYMEGVTENRLING
ncbi:hypothetical protein DMI70_19680 [Escherichia coli]|nr:hypothetical protein [Escherichia coli]